MALTENQEREEAQKSALNAARYRKTKLQQAVRKNILKPSPLADESDDIPDGSQHKNRLALLKAGAIKKANAEAGAAVGEAVGGALGSILPGPGNVIGIFLGRYFGKKTGIIRIIMFIIFSLLFLLLFFIAILKGYCDTYAGTLTDYFTTNICPNLQ